MSNKTKAEYQMEYRKRHPRYQQEFDAKAKVEVLAAYGNKCSCCGENESHVFLTVDHRNNDGGGATRRRRHIYRYLRFKPVDHGKYQILCWNCNCGRALTPTKECPHQLKKFHAYHRKFSNQEIKEIRQYFQEGLKITTINKFYPTASYRAIWKICHRETYKEIV